MKIVLISDAVIEVNIYTGYSSAHTDGAVHRLIPFFVLFVRSVSFLERKRNEGPFLLFCYNLCPFFVDSLHIRILSDV